MENRDSEDHLESKGSSIEEPDIKRGKIEITGDGGEFVIIDNHKYYRHELMAAFGGTLNPGPAPYPSININPAPVGLVAFALSTFVLSLFNAQAMGIKVPNVAVSLACFYGGAVQFLSGCGEFFTGNTFACTALTSYGAFWLSYGVIFVDSFGIMKSYKETDELNNAVGFFLLGWALFTFMMFLLTLKATVAFCTLFGTLFMMFLLLAAGNLSGHVGVVRAGGVFGVITAVTGWWNAFAGVATPYNSYIKLSPIPMPGNILFHKKSS
ncbi:mug86 [Candida oxycetoniae]|uniref:Mug86 n=1 Tax=Candida oxycetoniae TaxID=497107 RepID=A0AAI9STJ2_9ASCO|nr:mug86 [Candida oxycetoniae]KAI3402538.1 mug86 [Candida oxycetoniae]